MKTARRQVKGSKTKPKKAKITKASAPRDKRDVGALISRLDVSSLHKDDISTLMQHFSSALNFHNLTGGLGITSESSSASYCYTKSGSSDTVSIWSGGFKVAETSEADAKAKGILPCG
jgi:hypothetical protein